MTQMTLTKTKLSGGIWEGELTGIDQEQAPQLLVTHESDAVDGLQIAWDEARSAWRITLPVPAHLISDGVQTFIISDAQGKTLGSFALLAGEALAEDIRAEVNLLRSELDLLKAAFRQHCQNS